MSKDFVPDSFQNLFDWADHLHDAIAIHGITVGWNAARITAFQTIVAPIRDAAQTVLDKQSELDTATGVLRQVLSTNLPEIRLDANNIKSSRGYNDGMGDDLGITTSSDTLDVNTYKPLLKATVYPGHVRLSGKKFGADALNIYVRLRGEVGWKLLAAKRKRLPFDDDAPLSVAHTPETREYRAIGVVGDQEIGQPSDIITAVYGG